MKPTKPLDSKRKTRGPLSFSWKCSGFVGFTRLPSGFVTVSYRFHRFHTPAIKTLHRAKQLVGSHAFGQWSVGLHSKYTYLRNDVLMRQGLRMCVCLCAYTHACDGACVCICAHTLCHNFQPDLNYAFTLFPYSGYCEIKYPL